MATSHVEPTHEGAFELPLLFRHAAIMERPKRMVQYELDAAGRAVREWRSDSDQPPDDQDALAAVEARGHVAYEILETGGFLKLYRKPTGRMYWHLQACCGNRAPDWKIHFSIHPEDSGKAWDAIASLFLELRCHAGMKIQTQGDSWPAYQRGREITVYIPLFSTLFAPHMDAEVHVGPEMERPPSFWFDFVARAEAALARAGVRSRGLADGDLSLGGTYASLRNEAFVRQRPEWQLPPGWTGVDLGRGHDKETWIYPPNTAGHNAAGHRDPLRTRSAWQALDSALPWVLLAAAAAAVCAAMLIQWRYH
jgi:hypothetical protein